MKVFLLLLLLEPTPQLEAEQLVSNFYGWYTNGGYREMKATFSEQDNGFTTLDFSKYDELHRNYGFSNQLIEESKAIYEQCRLNLSTVPYSDFQQFDDLSQFEQINCDFQFFRWFGSGMEPFQHYELTETKKLSNNKYEITVGLAWRKDEELARFIPVTVERRNSNWQITEIKLE